jgi:hypothetical protein
VSDLASRYVLGVDGHPAISLERTIQHFVRLFETCGLPNRIRTDNGTPFASSALARLSQLSVWFIKLGIYPELIEPGKPQQKRGARADAPNAQAGSHDSSWLQPARPAT